MLSRVFRGKFLALLRSAFDRGRLSFHGKLTPLADAGAFQRRLTAAAQTEWVAYAKPPFSGPEQVLKYLARYTHRAAISNRRLIGLESEKVEFLWKDYAHGGRRKTMTLKGVEFIRRFLLHVLPTGFVRVRHYGFLANRACQKLALCRALLAGETPTELAETSPSSESPAATASRPDGTVCPVCGEGRLVTIEMLPATPAGREETRGLVLQVAGSVEGPALD